MSFEELDLSNESNHHQVTPDNVNQKPPRLLLIVLNGIAALLCTVAAILSLMGENGASIEVGSVRVVNFALLVGVAAFACLLVSFIAQKRKWRPSGASGVKAGALVFLFLLFCLIFVFRYPAFLMVTWTSASAVDESVHYQYQLQSDYGSRHAVRGDSARNVAFFGSSRSFRVVMEGGGYASCQSSGEACDLTECAMDQIWWVGGLQWGFEVDRDAGASGMTKALTCKAVDSKAITIDNYDEQGYRHE